MNAYSDIRAIVGGAGASVLCAPCRKQREAASCIVLQAQIQSSHVPMVHLTSGRAFCTSGLFVFMKLASGWDTHRRDIHTGLSEVATVLTSPKSVQEW